MSESSRREGAETQKWKSFRRENQGGEKRGVGTVAALASGGRGDGSAAMSADPFGPLENCFGS